MKLSLSVTLGRESPLMVTLKVVFPPEAPPAPAARDRSPPASRAGRLGSGMGIMAGAVSPGIAGSGMAGTVGVRGRSTMR